MLAPWAVGADPHCDERCRAWRIAKGVSKSANVVEKEVPLAWIGVEEKPVMAVNQAYSQFDNNGMFVLTLGLANTPPLMRGKRENQKLLDAIEVVTVTPVARFAMTEGYAESLIKALQTNLKQYRAVKKRREGK